MKGSQVSIMEEDRDRSTVNAMYNDMGELAQEGKPGSNDGGSTEN